MTRARLIRVTAWVAWLFVAWLCLGVFLFVAPPRDTPARVDVVFVLAPAYDRLATAEQLMDEGYADTLAVSSPPNDEGKPAPAICHEERAYAVICFDPDPVTTQGEARALQRLSVEHGWHSANVVTSQFHVTRARVLLQRCYEGELDVVPYWQNMPILGLPHLRGSWAYHYAYETAAFAKVLLNPGC